MPLFSDIKLSKGVELTFTVMLAVGCSVDPVVGQVVVVVGSIVGSFVVV